MHNKFTLLNKEGRAVDAINLMHVLYSVTEPSSQLTVSKMAEAAKLLTCIRANFGINGEWSTDTSEFLRGFTIKESWVSDLN
jgi:hypothetical protein